MASEVYMPGVSLSCAHSRTSEGLWVLVALTELSSPNPAGGASEEPAVDRPTQHPPASSRSLRPSPASPCPPGGAASLPYCAAVTARSPVVRMRGQARRAAGRCDRAALVPGGMAFGRSSTALQFPRVSTPAR